MDGPGTSLLGGGEPLNTPTLDHIRGSRVDLLYVTMHVATGFRRVGWLSPLT